jgi:ADP-heptose:LPS heptosyltransferase
MAKILISPYSRPLQSGKPNPKNYPYWKQLIELIKDNNDTIQIGLMGEEKLVDDCRFNLSAVEIEQLVKQCDFFISIDSFLPHLAHYVGKKGIVIFSQSDPNIFGYKENVNILKDRSYLRPNQFATWDESVYDKSAYKSPDYISHIVKDFTL